VILIARPQGILPEHARRKGRG